MLVFNHRLQGGKKKGRKLITVLRKIAGFCSHPPTTSLSSPLTTK